jgi:MFS family permease
MGIAPKWRMVALLWMVCWLNYADRQAIFALFPLLRGEFGVSNVRLALVGSSFMWVYALFGPVAGWMGDRLPRRRLILGGMCMWLVATAATILSHSFWQMVVLRGLSGLAEAMYFPAAMSMIAAYHGPETRSRAMAAHQSAVYVGTMGGGILAALIGERLGWRASFFVFGAVGILILVLVFGFLKEPAKEAAPAAGVGIGPALRETLMQPLAARLVAVFIGANFVAMIFMVWLPSFLYGKFHMSLTTAGVSATVYLQVAAVAGVLAGGVLADRWSRRWRGGRMWTQAVGLLAGAPFLFLGGWSPTVGVLIAALVGLGVCKGIYESNLWASLYDVVPQESRATAVGLMNALGWLGGGVAPLALAAASERFTMSQCLSATSCVYLLGGGVLVWNAKKAGARG